MDKAVDALVTVLDKEARKSATAAVKKSKNKKDPVAAYTTAIDRSLKTAVKSLTSKKDEKIAARKKEEESSEEESSEDEESSEEESEEETSKSTKKEESSSGEEESSEEESSEEETAKSSEKKSESSSGEEESSSGEEESSSGEEESSSEEEEEAKPSKKRKAEPSNESSKKAAVAGEPGSVFVGSLSWNVDDNMLQEHFSSCPGVTGARVITQFDGKSKGFGYVDFSEAAGVEAAIELSGSVLDGREIRVDRAESKPKAAPRRSFGGNDGGTSAPTQTLFIGNMSWNTDENSIRNNFGEYGQIVSVRIVTDRETQRPKGFGYIQFSSSDEAVAAFNDWNGQELDGRTIRLDYAQERSREERGGGGGYGGRGSGFGGRGRGRGRGRGGRGGGRGRGSSNPRRSGSMGTFSGSAISFD